MCSHRLFCARRAGECRVRRTDFVLAVEALLFFIEREYSPNSVADLVTLHGGRQVTDRHAAALRLVESFYESRRDRGDQSL